MVRTLMTEFAATEDPAAMIRDVIARLREATAEYREALPAAAEAVCAQYAQQREVETVEAIVRWHATMAATGASEKRTAAERDALIANTIATHPEIGSLRTDALRLRQAVETTRARAAVADQAQKALRAELAALTVLAQRGIE